ncbi:MAG TPA: hypothetical protein VFX70_05335 [Mycobacteriales bacterium]|nr:hypothetical protein [Mycobacteriales bacterium]
MNDGRDENGERPTESSSLTWDGNRLVEILVGLAAVTFTVIWAFVSSTTWNHKIAVVLSAVAGGLVLIMLGKQISQPRPEKWWYVRCGAGALLLIGAAVFVYSYVPSPSSRPTARNSARKPVIVKKDYVLRPSQFFTTNDQDKVDIDSGCPGRGETKIQIGPERCGRLADLIVDSEGVHTADGGPHLLRLDRSVHGSYGVCRAALTGRPHRAVGNIDVDYLMVGDQLCVATDERDTGLVSVVALAKDSAGGLTSLTINFDVWRNGSGHH